MSFDELPYPVKKTLLEKQSEIIIDMMAQAGLLLEFYEFFQSIDPFDKTPFEYLCTQFAEKYPDKFHIVPKENRYDKVFVCEIDKT